MATIKDYLTWRGDLSFGTDPLNEVDNYILAKVGCPDYSGIIPESGGTVPLRDAVRAFFESQKKDDVSFGALASGQIASVLRRLPGTQRFGEVGLTGFIKKLEPSSPEQFSALTLLLPDRTAYVSFRGTDDTLIGWKENMMMSVTDAIPAQKDALAYLNMAARRFSGPLIVGGHSKGGNLAVYAAAMADPAIQRRIRAVYNNDGPGFTDAFLQQEGYLRIRPKLHTLLPQFTLVGMMLKREKNVSIVLSPRPGPSAHDGFQWEVSGPRFVRCEQFSRSSLSFEESLHNVLEGMDTEARITFISQLFNTLEEAGASTVTDLSEMQARKGLELFRKVRNQPEVGKFLSSLIEQMLKDYASGTRAGRVIDRLMDR